MTSRVSRLSFAVAVIAVGAVMGACPQQPTSSTSTSSAPSTPTATKPNDADRGKPGPVNLGAEDGKDDDVPEGLSPVMPKVLDPEAKLYALEAELAALRHNNPSARPAPVVPNSINAHEHLRRLEDLEHYLPAARAAGIAATVLVASPEFTLNGKGNMGEPVMSENFEEILRAEQKYPGEVIPFCTLDTKDSDKLERLKKHVAMGAKGLKLYSGHSNFYANQGPLNAPDMEPVWDYLEQTGLPIVWHVSLAKYFDEFSAVMDGHPKLNMMVPHYGVTFWRPKEAGIDKLKTLLRKHKNLLVDTSLGTREILIDGMATMDPARDVFIQIFQEFQDQIVWGTDSVITGNPEKTTGWFGNVIWATRDALEKDRFQTPLGAAYTKYWKRGRDPDGWFRGLGLPVSILEKVYVKNAMRWLKLDKAPVAKPLELPVLPTTTTPAPMPAATPTK